MRYSQDHKAQTHQRIIIKEASVRFRRDGIGATGLQPLMKALNLTHGGFYSHFRPKDELVEKPCRLRRQSWIPTATRYSARNSHWTRLSITICWNGTRVRPARGAHYPPCPPNSV